jgi:hypothetical protein
MAQVTALHASYTSACIPSSPRGLRRPAESFFSTEVCHGVIRAYKKDTKLEAQESKMAEKDESSREM